MQKSTSKTGAPLWLLILITISGTLAMHMFVPALPDAAIAFGTTRAAMQMTISVYILGLAGGQLIYGPLSDGLGRRPMLLTGLAVYTAAGVAAACAINLHGLVIARLFQALGGCAGLALGRAIVRDTTRTEDAVGTLALMNLMMMVGPGLSPLLGSGLVGFLGWRSIFVVLTALGAVTLFFTWRLLPETGKPSGQLRLSTLVSDYAWLLRSPPFLGLSLGGGCTTTSFYAFIAAAPFIITNQLHRPLHELGIYLGLTIVGMSIGNALTRRLVHSLSIDRLMIIGSSVSVASAAMLLIVVVTGYLNVGWTVGLMFMFALGAGTASPAALTKALSVNPKVVGSAAGLYGATQMAVGALCTYMVGFGHNAALSTALVLLVAAILGQCGFWVALGSQRAQSRASAVSAES